MPTRQVSAGQKREESGVSTSSIRVSRPSASTPNSNLVSAMMMPRARACSAAKRYSASAALRTARASVAPMQPAASSNEMFSIVLARRGLGGGREDRLGQRLRLLQSRGQGDAADCRRCADSPSSPSRSGSRAPPPRCGRARRRLTMTARPCSMARSRWRRRIALDERLAAQVIGHDAAAYARTRNARSRRAPAPCPESGRAARRRTPTAGRW